MNAHQRIRDLGLLLRTVRHLRPPQVLHRIRLRGQKTLMHSAPALTAFVLKGEVPITAGWPDGFRSLDARLGEGSPDATTNAEGMFDFVGERHGVSDDWEPGQASQLWRYHLHYMEWAWAFAAHAERQWARDAFLRLWQAWRRGTVVGRWDAWSPYVVSLRAWTLCGLFEPLVAREPHEDAYVEDVAFHANFIRANLEHDVGGNHLVKNLKGLIGTSVFLGDGARERLALRKLYREVAIQVLDDGGHFERSPSYHCQVLADLIDVRGLLRAAGRPGLGFLDDAIERMQRWLGAMLLPDGDVPLFNDGTSVGQDRLAMLEPTTTGPVPLVVLGESGYVVMRPSPRVHVVADVGPPCPPELPAHAQADCLSFVMSVDGQRFIVDTGTSTYRPGPIRDHERSTRAHNTVEVAGLNQTEVWGAFRAARRAMPYLEEATSREGVITVSASHDGYQRLPGRPRHRRTWRSTEDALKIEDELIGTRWYPASSRFHLAPGIVPTWWGGTASIKVLDCLFEFEGCNLKIFAPNSWDTEYGEHAWSATSFGARTPIAVIAQHASNALPVRFSVTIRWPAEGSHV